MLSERGEKISLVAQASRVVAATASLVLLGCGAPLLRLASDDRSRRLLVDNGAPRLAGTEPPR